MAHLTTRLQEAVLRRPLLVLTLLLAAQTVPALWSKDVWVPDEVRHAAVFLNLVDDGHWLVLYLGDAPYADKPPVYFWLLAGLSWLIGSTEPHLFMLAAAVTAWGFLAAHVIGGRAMGLPRETVLVAGFLLLSNWFFIERAHQPRMDLLFASFIFLSHMAFFRAVRGREGLSTGWTLLAFGMAGAAVLTKGPLGIAMPLVTVLAYAGWARKLRLLASLPVALGAGLFAAMMGAYVGGILLVEGPEFLRMLVVDQTLDRAVQSSRQAEPWHFYLWQTAIAALPWTLLLFVLPWRRLVRRETWEAIAPRARPDDPVVYLAIAYVSGLILLSVLDYKNVFFLVMLHGVLALLAAEALRHLAPGRRMALTLAVAAFLALLAALLPVLNRMTAWADTVEGYGLLAALLAVAAALTFAARRTPPVLATGAVALGIAIASLPFYLRVIPSLDPIMAPRGAGEALRAEAARGFTPAEYHPFNVGEFDYHARIDVRHLRSAEELAAFLATEPCAVLAGRRWVLDSYWPDRPLTVTQVFEARIDQQIHEIHRWSEGDCPEP